MQATVKSIEDKVKEHKKRQTLIAPKNLEKIIKALKLIILCGILFVLARWLKKYLGQNDEEGEEENSLSKADKKELLLKRKYSSSTEEIRVLFLQFLKAVQKVHYPDEEEQLPPPKILNKELLEHFTRCPKSLSYFLEVFSLCEYRNQKITSPQLNKYRKAYKKLINVL